MDALIFRASVLLAATLSLGAGYPPSSHVIAHGGNTSRSQHFIVTAPTQQFAREVCQAGRVRPLKSPVIPESAKRLSGIL